MKSRFETYVEESLKEATAGKRAKLQAAYNAEVAKIDGQRGKYLKMAEDGVEALFSKIVAQAQKDGCIIDETETIEAGNALTDYVKGKIKSSFGLQAKYDSEIYSSRWPEGTLARKAQDAIRAFDENCAKEARKLVVYKMDLGMKPDAFEKMLAEAAAKINKE